MIKSRLECCCVLVRVISLEILQQTIHPNPQAPRRHDNHADIVQSRGVCTLPAQHSSRHLRQILRVGLSPRDKRRVISFSIFTWSTRMSRIQLVQVLAFSLFTHNFAVSEVTTNASATSVAGATFNASETLVTLGAQSFIWRDVCGLGETTLALETQAFVEPCAFWRQNDVSPAEVGCCNRFSL